MLFAKFRRDTLKTRAASFIIVLVFIMEHTVFAIGFGPSCTETLSASSRFSPIVDFRDQNHSRKNVPQEVVVLEKKDLDSSAAYFYPKIGFSVTQDKARSSEVMDYWPVDEQTSFPAGQRSFKRIDLSMKLERARGELVFFEKVWNPFEPTTSVPVREEIQKLDLEGVRSILEIGSATGIQIMSLLTHGVKFPARTEFVAIEQEAPAYANLVYNVTKWREKGFLKGSKVECYYGDMFDPLKTQQRYEKKFDLIFTNPYPTAEFAEKFLSQVDGFLAPGGRVVMLYPLQGDRFFLLKRLLSEKGFNYRVIRKISSHYETPYGIFEITRKSPLEKRFGEDVGLQYIGSLIGHTLLRYGKDVSEELLKEVIRLHLSRARRREYLARWEDLRKDQKNGSVILPYRKESEKGPEEVFFRLFLPESGLKTDSADTSISLCDGKVKMVLDETIKEVADQDPKGRAGTTAGRYSSYTENPVFPGLDLKAVEEKREKDFETYLEKEGLAPYTRLHSLFSSRIQEVLLRDSVLRPVFLEVIPDKSLGEIMINPALSPQEKKEAQGLMEAKSVFKVGTPEVALKALLSGKKVVVGVTDRVSDKSFMPQNMVANGRQVYLPLHDGSWLGIKGSGQNNYEGSAPFFYNDEGVPYKHRWEGLAWRNEAEAAIERCRFLQDSGFRSVRMMGYRKIFSAPDGKGGLEVLENIEDKNRAFSVPVLIFNKVATPHRLMKFPQIIESDPYLDTIALEVSKGMRAMGYLEEDETLTSEQMMREIFRQLARGEAEKVNRSLHKKSVHVQDFTFAGEEADNEEFLTDEEYRSRYEKEVVLMKFEELHSRTGINAEGLHNKLEVLVTTIKMGLISLGKDMKRQGSPLPDPNLLLMEFFGSFFSYLENDILMKLTEDPDHRGVPEIIKEVVDGLAIEVFHPDYIDAVISPEKIEIDREKAEKEVLHKIVEKAYEEKLSRVKVEKETVDFEQGWEILGSTDKGQIRCRLTIHSRGLEKGRFEAVISRDGVFFDAQEDVFITGEHNILTKEKLITQGVERARLEASHRGVLVERIYVSNARDKKEELLFMKTRALLLGMGFGEIPTRVLEEDIKLANILDSHKRTDWESGADWYTYSTRDHKKHGNLFLGAGQKEVDSNAEERVSRLVDAVRVFVESKALEAKNRDATYIVGVDVSWLPSVQKELGSVWELTSKIEELCNKRIKGCENLILHIEKDPEKLAERIRRDMDEGAGDISISDIAILGWAEVLKDDQIFGEFRKKEKSAYFAMVNLPYGKKEIPEGFDVDLLWMMNEMFRILSSPNCPPQFYLPMPEVKELPLELLSELYQKRSWILTQA